MNAKLAIDCLVLFLYFFIIIAIGLRMDRHTREPGVGHDREAFEMSEQARARSTLRRDMQIAYDELTKK